MKHIWSKKLADFFHSTRTVFNKVFIVIAVLFFGTAMLATNLFFSVVSKVTYVYKVNPSLISTIVVAMICIPLISYVLEKSLNSYLQQK